jgi:uncharacterized Rmd1/YagE family protein
MDYKIVSYHLGDRIQLNTIVKHIFGTVEREEENFQLIKAGIHKYVYVKSYGSIVFFGFTEVEISNILKNRMGQKRDSDNLLSEHFVLTIDPKTQNIKVNFNTIVLSELSTDIIHVIMFNLAQAVALDNYQDSINKLLYSTRKISKELMDSGIISTSRNKMKKLSGKTMVLKNRIAEDLYIFDTPDLIWSAKTLSGLDKAMSIELDFEKRHKGLQNNIDIVSENLNLFRDILQHKHSSMLEWIIIILIVIEIIQILMEKVI